MWKHFHVSLCDTSGKQYQARARRRRRRGRYNTDEEARAAGVEARQDDGTIVDPFTASHSSDPRRPAADDAVRDGHQGEDAAEGRRRRRAGRGGRWSRVRRRQPTGWGTLTLPARVRRCRPLAHLLSLLQLRGFMARGAGILLGVRSQPRLTRLDERSLHHRLSHQKSPRWISDLQLLLQIMDSQAESAFIVHVSSSIYQACHRTETTSPKRMTDT